MAEFEVFRSTPIVGRCYETGVATREQWVPKNYQTGKEGYWRYFSNKRLTYVGRHLRSDREGYGNGGTAWESFDRFGKLVQVEWNYEGTTIFREVPCQSDSPTKENMEKKTLVMREVNNVGMLPPNAEHGFPGGLVFQELAQTYEAKKSRKTQKTRKTRKTQKARKSNERC